jgi:archaellum biogenesis ATPase FlaH
MYTLEHLGRAEAALLESKEAIAFLHSRGISLETAQQLRFGFENARVVMPTFVDGELAAVKLRAIDPKTPDEKWRKQNRDKGVYWLFNRAAATGVADLYVTESELDAAMLVAHGFAAVSVDSAHHELTPQDVALLKSAKRVILASDNDELGHQCARRIETAISGTNCLCVVPQGMKDLGELYADDPSRFTSRLGKLVRCAATTRIAFGWGDLLTESEIIENQGNELRYIVDKLIPERRITMFYGQEKSGKSLLALYIAKCVVNGKKVFDNLNVKMMPCLYLDAEDGIVGAYLSWLRGIGELEIRFRTLQSGIPSLDDSALVEVCRSQRPLLIVDSLYKFERNGEKTKNVWNAAEIEPVMDKLRRLCVAGATVVLIHHSTKADPEQYRDSSAIGAGVDFMFAVVGKEPVNGVKRVRLVGQPSRGAQPPSLDLIAFPALVELAKFTLEHDPPKSDLERVVEYVSSCPNGAKKTIIRKKVRGRHEKVDNALEAAVQKGLLLRDERDVYSVPDGGAGMHGDVCLPPNGNVTGTEADENCF